jgi:hypothetical protein
MGLISSRFMTADQRERCCYNDLSVEVIGYAIDTIDGQRIGTVDDILMDDESMTVRYLVVDTSTAAFILNQPHLLLPTNLCCWDRAERSVRSQAHAEQVQSAPAYDAAVSVTQAYEDTIITHYGERPYAPADT